MPDEFSVGDVPETVGVGKECFAVEPPGGVEGASDASGRRPEGGPESCDCFVESFVAGRVEEEVASSVGCDSSDVDGIEELFERSDEGVFDHGEVLKLFFGGKTVGAGMLKRDLDDKQRGSSGIDGIGIGGDVFEPGEVDEDGCGFSVDGPRVEVEIVAVLIGCWIGL